MEVPSGKLPAIRHRMVKTNGISMHIVEQGAGPMVLLLHGFPEFWYSWRFQIPALAEAGYHVVAPDLRGYGQSDAPKSAQAYTSCHLVGDLVGLLDALEEKRVFVVGHDWGAMVAWDLCLLRPDCVKAVVCLSVPFFPRSPKGSAIKGYYETVGEGFYMCRYAIARNVNIALRFPSEIMTRQVEFHCDGARTGFRNMVVRRGTLHESGRLPRCPSSCFRHATTSLLRRTRS
jgi:pimeloyl-ACP methyl ester carboxylesterase